MAEKSDIVPTDPLSWRVTGDAETRWSWQTSVNVYRDWTSGRPASQLGDEPDVVVSLPWFMSATILDGPDKSDPDNKLRVYCIRIGKTLAFRAVFAAGIVGDEDVPRLALLAAMMIGAEHGAEIRDAIERERSRPPVAG
jgi:hypothetical protein